jgi:hypothetical protein
MEQAMELVDPYAVEGDFGPRRLNAEKFAELIVRECSAFVYNYPEKYLTRNQAREISMSMEEHFEVES